MGVGCGQVSEGHDIGSAGPGTQGALEEHSQIVCPTQNQRLILALGNEEEPNTESIEVLEGTAQHWRTAPGDRSKLLGDIQPGQNWYSMWLLLIMAATNTGKTR